MSKGYKNKWGVTTVNDVENIQKSRKKHLVKDTFQQKECLYQKNLIENKFSKYTQYVFFYCKTDLALK